MRRPRVMTYVIGNSVSTLAILGGSGFLVYQWWAGAGLSDWTPLLAAVACGAALNANEKLTTYQAWRLAWDNLNGEARPRRRFPFRVFFGVLLWLVMALGLTGLNYHHHPENVFALVCFGLASLLMLVRLCSSAGRGAKAAPRRVGKTVVVSIASGAGQHSPSIEQCRRSLPDYCRRLMAPAGEV